MFERLLAKPIRSGRCLFLSNASFRFLVRQHRNNGVYILLHLLPIARIIPCLFDVAYFASVLVEEVESMSSCMWGRIDCCMLAHADTGKEDQGGRTV